MPITRGATITNEFTVAIDFTDAVAMYITYEQVERTILEKSIEDCNITATKISVNMTQEESLRFIEEEPVKIQIRVKTLDGTAYVSKIIKTTVSELLKGGVI